MVNVKNLYFFKLYQKADRLLFMVVTTLLLVSFALAPWYHTWMEVLTIGVPAWAVCAWLVTAFRGAVVTRCAIGAALMVFATLQIHQSHGMIEAHFAIFVLLAFLLFYRDWVPLAVAAVVIAALHLSFDLLQRAGQPVWVFAATSGFGIVILHAAFVVIETALLVWMSLQLRGEIEAMGGDPTELSTASRELAKGNLSVDIETTGASETSLVCAMEAMRAELKVKIDRETAVSAELKANGERERINGEENSRIRVALDRIGAGAIVVDLEDQIIYANDFAISIFCTHATEFRKVLPRFDAESIVGSSFATFDGVPALRGNVLAGLEGTKTIDVVLGGARLKVTANPVVDVGGKRLGTVMQWLDRTLEVLAEEEVKSTVAAAIEGNLTVRILEEGKEGFFRTLAEGMNLLVGNQAEVLRTISTSATEVGTGAEEISRGNVDLSERTEQQASSLEQTAASMEQMTAAVKNNADNAAQASQLAMAARDQAERGGAVVQSAITAMSEINASSKKIADIIGVIDDIAFQTNLLALNAAVEAARAGEQGRGFAVVASEVRNLASRSAAAAKEIKGLIQESVGKVQEGGKLVDASGQVLREIVAGVKKVTDVVTEIAASSQEQSSGIEQVNKAVMSMDEGTQQNAALVEQATAAAQSLNEQAASLTRLMARFELGVKSTKPSPVAKRPTAMAAAPNRVASGPNAMDRHDSKRSWAKSGKVPTSASRPSATSTIARAAAGASEWSQF
jgi:methyl-accepting chemotaxis protein